MAAPASVADFEEKVGGLVGLKHAGPIRASETPLVFAHRPAYDYIHGRPLRAPQSELFLQAEDTSPQSIQE